MDDDDAVFAKVFSCFEEDCSFKRLTERMTQLKHILLVNSNLPWHETSLSHAYFEMKMCLQRLLNV